MTITKAGGQSIHTNPLFKGGEVKDSKGPETGKAGSATKVEYGYTKQATPRTEEKISAYKERYGEKLGTALLKAKVTISNALSQVANPFRKLGAFITEKLANTKVVENSVSDKNYDKWLDKTVAYTEFKRVPTRDELATAMINDLESDRGRFSDQEYVERREGVQTLINELKYTPMKDLLGLATANGLQLRPDNVVRKEQSESNQGGLERDLRGAREAIEENKVLSEIAFEKLEQKLEQEKKEEIDFGQIDVFDDGFGDVESVPKEVMDKIRDSEDTQFGQVDLFDDNFGNTRRMSGNEDK